jgi:hypothetical protein
MKWRLFVFGFLSGFFSILAARYAGKDLVIYNRSSMENVYETETIYRAQQVIKTYHENYASIGGAIGFAILGGVSLLCFSLHLKEKSRL